MPSRQLWVVGLAILGSVLLLLGGLYGLGIMFDQATTNHSNIGEVDMSSTGLEPTTPFEYDGKVHFGLDPSATSDTTFEHVKLCLYDANGSVLASRDLGTFEAPSTYKNFSVRTDEVPHYILVHHPRFREIEGFEIELWVYRPSRETFVPRGPSQLPFDYDKLDEQSCQPSS